MRTARLMIPFKMLKTREHLSLSSNVTSFSISCFSFVPQMQPQRRGLGTGAAVGLGVAAGAAAGLAGGALLGHHLAGQVRIYSIERMWPGRLLTFIERCG